ncbi:MAG: hypothetical protein WD757_07785 [Actinomycetota bacterium]
MLGEQEATTLVVETVDVHGVIYMDVTLRFPDDAVETARLGVESVPQGLRAAEKVVVVRAANVVVSLRRPE